MKIIDLTIPLNERTSVYPGDPKVKFKKVNSIDKDGETVYSISFSSQTGTHVETQYHMLKKGKKLSEEPLERFIGKAAIIDIPCRTVKIKDLEPKENLIRSCEFLVLRSGYQDYMKKINPEDKNRPMLALDVIRWITLQKIKLFAIDAFGFDYGPEWLGHKHLLKNNIIIAEGLCNLKKIKKETVQLFIVPLKFDGTEGSSCRAFAIEE